MTSWLIDDDDSYAQIIERAHHRLARDKSMGGTQAKQSLSRFHDIDEHVTEHQRRGEPCLKCGSTWPCGVYYLALSPD